MDAERLNLLKNDRSGNGNGLELSERGEKHHFFPSKRNKEQRRHVLVGTINFHLVLVATRNLVELVRSRRRLGGVSDTPVEGPISFNGGRERTQELPVAVYSKRVLLTKGERENKV